MARGRTRQGPLVSVIMAAYNAAPFVGPAIESVLRQTYPHIELVVVDDASRDGTPDVVQRYVDDSRGRVRLTRLAENGGPCRARNIALEQAQGELICWLDDDDLWLPTKVERQVAVMRANPDVGLVYTYFDAFDSDTGKVMAWVDGRRDIEGDVFGELCAIGCFIGSLTVMFRRAALARGGPRLREKDFSFGDDYDLWLRIALDWRVASIPEVLALYRRHSQNESSRLSRGNAHLMNVRLLREFGAAFPEASQRLGSRWRRALGRHLLLAARLEGQRGHRAKALTLAIRAAWQDPELICAESRRGAILGR